MECLFFCGDLNIKYKFTSISSNEVTYEASILRTFGLFKAHSDYWKNILESTSDIPWKYIELIFSNTLSPITQCSSASPSVSETCK